MLQMKSLSKCPYSKKHPLLWQILGWAPEMDTKLTETQSSEMKLLQGSSCNQNANLAKLK